MIKKYCEKKESSLILQSIYLLFYNFFIRMTTLCVRFRRCCPTRTLNFTALSMSSLALSGTFGVIYFPAKVRKKDETKIDAMEVKH